MTESQAEMGGRILAIEDQLWYPSQDPAQRLRYPLIVVLVAGEVGDYAAYIGFGDPEWVARHGDKLSYERARGHFPSLKREKYRD
jgi:hypothetical protein